MTTYAKFQRYGRGVYQCSVCKRNTRNTGSEEDCEMCADCYDLSGKDNYCNDNRKTAEEAGYTKAIVKRMRKIEAKGGDVARVKGCFGYLFN